MRSCVRIGRALRLGRMHVELPVGSDLVQRDLRGPAHQPKQLRELRQPLFHLVELP